MWNSIPYFQNVRNKLKLAANNSYAFSQVSGINHLEDILTNMTRKTAFFAVDDSDSGVTVNIAGAYFDRRTITIYILRKFKLNDMTDRETKLNECRQIRTILQKRLIRDTLIIPELMYLDKSRMPFREMPGYFVGGTCGVYMTITIDEPLNLCYNADEFTD